ncbi:hypothetical protein QOM21_01185 [Streptomyces sp. Pv4-95]|uniref:hypothetical protein n=1 Tax=Streptomyces sp. Pv4-95 TaxID=3049543 RepID=UPI003892A0FB
MSREAGLTFGAGGAILASARAVLVRTIKAVGSRAGPTLVGHSRTVSLGKPRVRQLCPAPPQKNCK